MLFAQTFSFQEKDYFYSSLPKALASIPSQTEQLPFSLKILLENVLRQGKEEAANILLSWGKDASSDNEIPFSPARILMQDFTGVPAIVDFAVLRDGMEKLGKDPAAVNPSIPVDLVIDHSISVDFSGTQEALEKNMVAEFQKNNERYRFLDWAQKTLKNFRIIPPGNGICHQVNLEYLAPLVQNVDNILFPDSVFGTDSHTTMINGLGVLGWGVGGIEAEAASLGEAISMRIPEIIGMRLTGSLPAGTTATDLVLTITQKLRQKGVVGKFVEFFGPALEHLPVAHRATIANMAPEYGATCGFFPADSLTMEYLKLTGRDEKHIALAEAYLKIQGLFREKDTPDPSFTDVIAFDLGEVLPCMAGPKNPSERHILSEIPKTFSVETPSKAQRFPLSNGETIGNGDVVIAAITSCTNTSNPSVMIAAGLLAKKARILGLKPLSRIKTSLAPGSRAVSHYLEKSGLKEDLDALGFEVVGYGCTTCIGNSGPLSPEVTQAIEQNNLTVGAVLSGNRNFEGRISPLTKINYIASPPLVVAYALAGSFNLDLTNEPIGQDRNGKNVFLSDIWPNPKEIEEYVAKYVTASIFAGSYANAEKGSALWQNLKASEPSSIFHWEIASTYIHNPPWVDKIAQKQERTPIKNARILALFGDNVTTDHISPAGAIAPNSPAALYLEKRNIQPKDFNSYGSRRGNDEIMARGTFANIRIQNEIIPGSEGGITRHYPDGEEVSIFDAAENYKKENIPLIVIAGKNYGMGSSRDWAAKGPNLLGIKAIIAEDFERIHRSNLVGMGILPLRFPENVTRRTLKLSGEEIVEIEVPENLSPRCQIPVLFKYKNGRQEKIMMTACLETKAEILYFHDGGILPNILKRLAAEVEK
ncbi:aconitate hydratase AcnA [Acetobacteraceae bacterium]|nr:aconitate hydratase AcnA [Acetobacteraceae bacterium]